MVLQVFHIRKEARPTQTAHTNKGHTIAFRDQGEVNGGHKRPNG